VPAGEDVLATQPASSITPDRRDESYAGGNAAVHSEGQRCGAYVLLARLLEGLRASPIVPPRLCVGF
jgi:hypothetical protein